MSARLKGSPELAFCLGKVALPPALAVGRAARLPPHAGRWIGSGKMQEKIPPPIFVASRGTRSLLWVLLEAVDISTSSLEKAGQCWGLCRQLVVMDHVLLASQSRTGNLLLPPQSTSSRRNEMSLGSLLCCGL